MNRNLFCKTIVLTLTVCCIFAGCAAPAAPEQSAQAAVTETAQRMVVEAPKPEPLPFAMENPAIDASVSLPDKMPAVSAMAVIPAPQEVRSVWISYLELGGLLKGRTAKQFRTSIALMFDNVKTFGLNTVVVQVRPFADALYKSDLFPWSNIITGTEGKNPGFDPLAVMVEEARARKLRIEAWINPYRVRAAGSTVAISSGNQAKKWLDAGDDSTIKYNGIISYNPASEKARKLIVDGAVEIVANYDIDAIHIDDYFYPSTDAAFDQAAYARYTKQGGKLALADWRRANVETLVKSMYAAIKAENSKVMFGVSPQSSVKNNVDAQYLDVKKIASNKGYCDYICPQIYFGFQNGSQPYSATLKEWAGFTEKSGVKLYVGLAAYKIGATDSWAGAGKSEWINNNDLLARMVKEARGYSSFGGFAVYRYDSLFNPVPSVTAAVQREYKNLKAILK